MTIKDTHTSVSQATLSKKKMAGEVEISSGSGAVSLNQFC